MKKNMATEIDNFIMFDYSGEPDEAVLAEIEKEMEESNEDDSNEEAFISEVDCISQYLKEIGCTPLLTKEQEQELGRRIKEGDEEARKLLVEANLRLVASYAKKYKGMDYMDLVQEGNIGLMRAAKSFDPEKGFRFSTYATWWIKQNMQRAIADKGKVIRTPVHMNELIHKISRAKNKLNLQFGNKVTDEDIAKELGVEIEIVREAMRHEGDVASLDSPVGDEQDSTLADFVEDKYTNSPEEANMFLCLQEDIEYMLSLFPEKEANIIRMRFGLCGESAKTLEEVGRTYNVTRERIRQIESHALRRMRRDPRIRKRLEAYWENGMAS